MSEDPDDGPDGEGEEDRNGAGRDDDREAPLSGLADRVRRSRSDRERSESGRDRFDRQDAESGRDGGDGDRPDVEFETGGEAVEADETDPFETMEVETVDEEAVWESLESEDPEVTDQPEVGSGGDAERVEPTDGHGEAPEHVVQKSAYCQRCRFFSDPPEVRCTHEGTAIVEVVDSDRFRVRGCPMVEHGGPGTHDGRE